MNVWEFIDAHLVYTFFLGVFFFVVFLTVCELICKVWNRLMRMLNIRKVGWPPEHCDADGDFRQKGKYED